MSDLSEILHRLEEIKQADTETSKGLIELNGEVRSLGQQIAGLESWMKSHTEKQQGIDKDLEIKLERTEREARAELARTATEVRRDLSGLGTRLSDVEKVVWLLKIVVTAMTLPVLGMAGLTLFKIVARGTL